MRTIVIVAECEEGLARYLDSGILKLCDLNFSDTGRLACGHRALAASGGALRSPSARGRLTISGALLGTTRYETSPPQWRPLGRSASRERHARQPEQPLNRAVSALRAVDIKGRSARAVLLAAGPVFTVPLSCRQFQRTVTTGASASRGYS